MWLLNEANEASICSGLLVNDLPVFLSIEESSNFAIYPFSIILTQACDIESYFKSITKSTNSNGCIALSDRQIITQILFCPAFDEDTFFSGNHLKAQFGFSMPAINSKEKEKYYKSEFRYHYLKSNLDSIPNLFVDFKQYFTLPVEFVNTASRNNKFNYKLDHIYYTSLADRFAHYLQRVAIP